MTTAGEARQKLIDKHQTSIRVVLMLARRMKMSEPQCQAIEFVWERVKDPRASEIIAMRHGWGDYKKHLYREIGEAFGVTGGRIAQIYRKTFRILRHPKHNEMMTPSMRTLLCEVDA